MSGKITIRHDSTALPEERRFRLGDLPPDTDVVFDEPVIVYYDHVAKRLKVRANRVKPDTF